MTGYEVCRALRAASNVTPILAVSAAAMPADITQGLEVGFDEYLTKPITSAALVKAVERFRRAP